MIENILERFKALSEESVPLGAMYLFEEIRMSTVNFESYIVLVTDDDNIGYDPLFDNYVQIDDSYEVRHGEVHIFQNMNTIDQLFEGKRMLQLRTIEKEDIICAIYPKNSSIGIGKEDIENIAKMYMKNSIYP